MKIRRAHRNHHQSTPGEESTGYQPEKSPISLKEHVLRFLAGTALFSTAATIGTNIADGPGWEVRFGGHPAGTYEKTVTIPAWTEPGEISPVIKNGPTASLEQGQDYSVDGHPVQLQEHQKGALENYLDRIVSQVKTIEASGGEVTEINVVVAGVASDEHLGDHLPNANIGQSSDMNSTLAQGRANLVAESLQTLAVERNLNINIRSSGKEYILNDADAARIEDIAKAHGVSTEALLVDYNFNLRNNNYTPEQEHTLNELLASNRRADLSSSITLKGSPVDLGPCDKVSEYHPEETYIKTYDYPGKDPYSLKILPVPFYIPRMRKGKKNEQAGDSNDQPSSPLQPGITSETEAKPASTPEPETESTPTPESKKAVAGSKKIIKIKFADGSVESEAMPEGLTPAEGDDFAINAMRAAAERHDSRCLGFSIRRERPSRSKRVLAALAAAVPFIPVPWVTTADTNNLPPESSACVSYGVDQGYQANLGVTTLGLLAYSKLTGGEPPEIEVTVWKKDPVVTKTEVPHTEILVDNKGKIIGKVDHPERTEETSIAPEWQPHP